MLFDAIVDTIYDSLKLLPFLFCTYLVLEYIESKMNQKTIHFIQKAGPFGPIVGAVLGIIPQCGFSAAATNLYAGRVITIGTLLAVYLSTSDEMLPILLAESIPISTIVFILLIKVTVGIIVGTIIDYFIRTNKKDDTNYIKNFCHKENCKCNQGIFMASISHTFHILAYIALFTFAFNVVILFIGEENLGSIILNKPLLGEVLAGLVGMIPNCAASVLITKLYVSGTIGLGAMISGVLVGAGVGLMVLFRVNDNLKENFKIAGILYVTGVSAGFIISLISG